MNEEHIVLDIVADLNQAWFDATNNADFQPFEFKSCGSAWVVCTGDDVVWCSEDNEAGCSFEEEPTEQQWKDVVLAEIIKNTLTATKNLVKFGVYLKQFKAAPRHSPIISFTGTFEIVEETDDGNTLLCRLIQRTANHEALGGGALGMPAAVLWKGERFIPGQTEVQGSGDLDTEVRVAFIKDDGSDLEERMKNTALGDFIHGDRVTGQPKHG